MDGAVLLLLLGVGFLVAGHFLKNRHWRHACIATALLLIWVGGLIMLASVAFARDRDGRYAQSPLKGWFDQLRSRKGPCCSDADGYAVSDPEWKIVGDRYQVFVAGEWRDVPPDAVITEPNRVGKAMVWPLWIYDNGEPKQFRGIQCFMPGAEI